MTIRAKASLARAVKAGCLKATLVSHDPHTCPGSFLFNFVLNGKIYGPSEHGLPNCLRGIEVKELNVAVQT